MTVSNHKGGASRIVGLPVLGVVLLLACVVREASACLSQEAGSSASSLTSELQTGGSPKVNAPRFEGDVPISETAIFWFGQVTPTENYADVRVGYNDDHLLLHVAVFDRRLWYDTDPSPANLTDWDAVTLYLDQGGNVGSAPETDTYRFEGQLVWWEDRDIYQTAYRGDGNTWVPTAIDFASESSWRGQEHPNDDVDDRGWWLRYLIPFESLGLDGPPPEGTVWGLALALHDRDDAENTPIDDKVWPPAMAPQQPATWGQLAFGVPTYAPPPGVPGGMVTIRHGLEGATVTDADVGGSSVCGSAARPDYFPTWGTLNYAGKGYLNIQNQGDVSDWPCFSRYYVTFPLDLVPANKTIISATLTLYLWGGAGEGWDPGPKRSLIQALSVSTDWDESTITWNSAPLAQENLSATWVEPVDSYPGRPGIPYHWDVSRAAAEAYASGGPLRLAMYESDWAYQSGKYFDTCDTDEWGAEGRPTLRVTWGDALADLDKTALPTAGYEGDPITYTLSFLGTGRTLLFTDTLPMGGGAPSDLEVSGTSAYPTYDATHHRLTWSDTVSSGREVTIRYTVVIRSSAAAALVNEAQLGEVDGSRSTARAIVIANPYSIYLPSAARGGE